MQLHISAGLRKSKQAKRNQKDDGRGFPGWGTDREEGREPRGQALAMLGRLRGACYYGRMFNFGKPQTVGDWIVHIAGAIIAIFLVWWMLRMYVL